MRSNYLLQIVQHKSFFFHWVIQYVDASCLNIPLCSGSTDSQDVLDKIRLNQPIYFILFYLFIYFSFSMQSLIQEEHIQISNAGQYEVSKM